MVLCVFACAYSAILGVSISSLYNLNTHLKTLMGHLYASPYADPVR